MSLYQIEPCVGEEVWTAYLDLLHRIFTGAKDMFGYPHHYCKKSERQQRNWRGSVKIFFIVGMVHTSTRSRNSTVSQSEDNARSN